MAERSKECPFRSTTREVLLHPHQLIALQARITRTAGDTHSGAVSLRRARVAQIRIKQVMIHSKGFGPLKPYFSLRSLDAPPSITSLRASDLSQCIVRRGVARL